MTSPHIAFPISSPAPFPFAITPTNSAEKWMLEALKEAWKAYLEDEVPIGAVLVYEERIIARGHNQVELLRDATAHAEMLCLTAGSSFFENWRLADTTLYCTIEPCSMCLGAMLLSRVPKIVWGAPDHRHGAAGSWVDLLAKPHPMHTIAMEKGLLTEPCGKLLKMFFQRRRDEANRDRESQSWSLPIS